MDNMTSTMCDYNIEALTKDMQAIMRIQDWDITVDCGSATDMKCRGYDANTKGICTRDRKHGTALIGINLDHEENKITLDKNHNEGWFYTYVHEMIHTVHDGVSDQVETILEFVKDDVTRANLENDFTIRQEHLVNRLTKMILNFICAETFLEKYKKGDCDAETKATE